ncbi:hypothetical protein [Peterkaempfera sp. SMS 1(5)a]|uniref:hypothetical protein n=1 Tax=Peterkaempfera podocarpi TaxID=3232308 RepID=UPI0036724E8E
MPRFVIPQPDVIAPDLAALTSSELTVALYASSLDHRDRTRPSHSALAKFAQEGVRVLGPAGVDDWSRRLLGFWAMWMRDLETPELLADHRSRFPLARRLKRCSGLAYGLGMQIVRRDDLTFERGLPLVDPCPCGGSGWLTVTTTALPASARGRQECPAHPATLAAVTAVAA